MDTLLFVIYGLLMGLVFGVALEKGRVFEPGMIVGQMQLRNFTMLKMFLTAMATTLVVLAVMNGVFGVALHPKATHCGAQVVGGLLFGVGMTLAGACPGTVMAQVGAGYKDAWFVLVGGILGATTFAYLHADIAPAFLAGGPGAVTLDRWLGLPFWALALIVAAVLAGALAALERWRPWRRDMGADFDGLSVPAPAEPRARPGKAGARARPRHA